MTTDTRTEFVRGDRVIDVRYDDPATVLVTAYNKPAGADGYGIVVQYDDEPDTPVSTGTDYFRRTA